MPRDRVTPVYALNIAATPHPAGVYDALLKRGAGYMAKAFGPDYAKITAPQEYEDGIFTGRIIVWTELDLNAPWYDLNEGVELSEVLRNSISIPDNARPNYRSFDYVFYEKKHHLYFESRNQEKSNLGPSTAKKIFETILDRRVQGSHAPSVEVTVIPTGGAVERILDMSSLSKLTIRVVLPNADATDPITVRRVRKRLTDAKAGRLEETYTKQLGASRLIPTPEIRDIASVAAENGFVRGEGRRNNQPYSLSTSNNPRREYIRDSDGATFLSRIRNSIGFF